MRILVLCAGNIGRSPVAEILLQQALADGLGVNIDDLAQMGVVVTSAGTEAPRGHEASIRGVRLVAGLGLDLTRHRATLLTASALRQADRVFGMDRDQIAAVQRLEPMAAAKTELLAGEGREIPDPHHQSDEFFADVFALLENAVADRAPELLTQIGTEAGRRSPD